MIAPSKRDISPPSAEKLTLIQKFMNSSGLQDRIDTGIFLEKYAFLPEIEWGSNTENASENEPFLHQLKVTTYALKSVYEKYRPQYQEAFEDHINWEFTEEELRAIVNFIESPLGKHYLDGSQRMEAYTGTTMEETEALIVRQAVDLCKSR